jgi:hypothetical protein
MPLVELRGRAHQGQRAHRVTVRREDGAADRGHHLLGAADLDAPPGPGRTVQVGEEAVAALQRVSRGDRGREIGRTAPLVHRGDQSERPGEPVHRQEVVAQVADHLQPFGADHVDHAGQGLLRNLEVDHHRGGRGQAFQHRPGDADQ